MTYIGVTTTSFQSEDRSWLLGPHGTEPGTTPSVTLDISSFTAGTHYPNGYVLSGTALGKITASGLYGPYDPDGSDGRQTAAGLLISSMAVPTNAAGTAQDFGGAILVHGFVDHSKLPFAYNVDGGLDANGIADLPLIHFVNAVTA